MARRDQESGQQNLFTYAELNTSGTKKDLENRCVKDGAGSLSDLELATVVVGEKHAGEALATMGGAPTGKVDYETLKEIAAGKGAAIMAVLELARRINLKTRQIITPADAFPFFLPYTHMGEQERFLVMTLNGAHEVQRIVVSSLGTLDRTLVHPREVFAPAFEDRASAIIVAHNHPSSSLNPSPEDLDVTKRLKQAGDILGIKVLDHLIVTTDGYYSLLEHGQL